MRHPSFTIDETDFALANCSPDWSSRSELHPAFHPLHIVVANFGKEFQFARPIVVVGRHSQCDLRLASPDVSRHHCRFMFQFESWWIQDRGSLNGVCVNGAHVESQEIEPGDRIQIAGFELIVPSTAMRLSERGVLLSIVDALKSRPSPIRRAS
jgi:pSer/pThr/pTyr-binding forkhead associated (FHA) protein